MSTTLLVVLILTSPIWVPVAFMLFVLAWLFVLWLFGMPMSIKVGGKKVGTIKWFTYRPVR